MIDGCRAPFLFLSEVFFFMCFFFNNQFRIIVEQVSFGSDNLEEVFSSNLRRIGRVLAVLDTWDQPRYLKRIWTIYEQYVACSMQVCGVKHFTKLFVYSSNTGYICPRYPQ